MRDRGELTATIAAQLAALFPLAAAETHAALIRAAQPREFRRHDTLLGQHEPWHMELILDGWVAVRRVSRSGRRFMIAALGPGQLAGASAASRSPAQGENVALTQGASAMWPGPLTRALARSDGGLAVDFIDRIVLGIGVILDRYDTVTFEGARTRLSRVLLAYREIAFDRQRPILSRGDLASLVGTSAEMVNRVLRELEASRAVRRTGARGLELVDESRLLAAGRDGPAGRRTSTT